MHGSYVRSNGRHTEKQNNGRQLPMSKLLTFCIHFFIVSFAVPILFFINFAI